MTDIEQILITFADGRLEPGDFEQVLYNDSALERYLREAPAPEYAGGCSGDLYVYMLKLDYSDPGDQLNAWGAVKWRLQENGIPFRPTRRYEEFHRLLLSVQPKWLDMPTEYFAGSILPAAAAGLSGKELAEWLRGEVKRRFRFVSKPPEWIQNPAWPIGENGPLVFLGQFAVKDYFHDEARVYVFHCPETGDCTTIIQMA